MTRGKRVVAALLGSAAILTAWAVSHRLTSSSLPADEDVIYGPAVIQRAPDPYATFDEPYPTTSEQMLDWHAPRVPHWMFSMRRWCAGDPAELRRLATALEQADDDAQSTYEYMLRGCGDAGVCGFDAGAADSGWSRAVRMLCRAHAPNESGHADAAMDEPEQVVNNLEFFWRRSWDDISQLANAELSREHLATLDACSTSLRPAANECLKVLAVRDWAGTRARTSIDAGPLAYRSFATALQRFETYARFADAGTFDLRGLSTTRWNRGLRELGHLSSGLDDVHYLVHDPVSDDGRNALRTWVGGTSYEFPYDGGLLIDHPRVVLGALNVMLRHRGITERWYAVEVLGESRPMLILIAPDDYARLRRLDSIRPIDPESIFSLDYRAPE